MVAGEGVAAAACHRHVVPHTPSSVRCCVCCERCSRRGEVRRVGDNKSSPVNVRVIGATNERLQPKLKDGTFREDLYYRLAVIPIEIPPLRDRLEDVPLLVNHFLMAVVIFSITGFGTSLSREPRGG